MAMTPPSATKEPTEPAAGRARAALDCTGAVVHEQFHVALTRNLVADSFSFRLGRVMSELAAALFHDDPVLVIARQDVNPMRHCIFLRQVTLPH